MKQGLWNLVLPGNMKNEFVLAIWLHPDQTNKQMIFLSYSPKKYY